MEHAERKESWEERTFSGLLLLHICLQDIDFRLLEKIYVLHVHRYNNIVEGYNVCAGIFLYMGMTSQASQDV